MLGHYHYRNIPNRSPGGLDKSLGGNYIRFRETNATLTNAIYKRNLPSKLGGASIRGSASNRDITVLALFGRHDFFSTLHNAHFSTQIPYVMETCTIHEESHSMNQSI